jgi:hypothetical protein
MKLLIIFYLNQTKLSFEVNSKRYLFLFLINQFKIIRLVILISKMIIN